MRMPRSLFILSAIISFANSAENGQLCKSECSVHFETLGCYKDEEVPNRRLPHYILNDRDSTIPNWSGKMINWQDWNNYMQDFACRCAEKAKEKGFDLFGLQFYGECWAGNSQTDMPKASDNSTECIQDDYQPCNAWNRFCIGHQWHNMIYRIVPEACDIKFERVGCYRDSHIDNARPLPSYPLNDRDVPHKGFSGKLIDWRNWDEYVPNIACRCAKKALERGSAFFGLQFYGECWTGDSKDQGELYSRNGETSTCMNNCYKKCKSYDKYCMGEHFTNFVYRIEGPCEVKFVEKGCYNESPGNGRLLTTEIRNEIDPISKVFAGKMISSHTWTKDFTQFLCNCARTVREKGYRYFGVNGIAQCFSGVTADQYEALGQSTKCYQGKKDQACTVGDKACAGWTADANFVYEIVNPLVIPDKTAEKK